MKIKLLIYSLIMIVIFVLIKITLNFYNLELMYSINQCIFLFIYITVVGGLIQVAYENKLALAGIILIIVIVSIFIMIGTILTAKEVKIITIENQKVVTETYGLPDDMTYYYKYINSFLRSYNEIEIEDKKFIEKFSNDSIIMEEDIVYKLYNQNTSYNSPKPFYND